MTFVGDVLPGFLFTVTDNTTGAAAAPSSFTVVLTAPDGTTPTVTVTNPSTGVYSVTYVAAQAGAYRATGTAVGNNCDGVSVLTWDVDPTAPSSLVRVEDVQDWLGAKTDSSRAELELMCLVASEAVEDYMGRKWRRQTVTEVYDGGKPTLNLRSTPVISVTSVTESGATVDPANYVLDAQAGLLHRGTIAGIWPWMPGVQNVSVTYVCGAANVPNKVALAARMTVGSLWAERSSGGKRSQPDDYAAPADLVPRQARYLLDSDRAPGF